MDTCLIQYRLVVFEKLYIRAIRTQYEFIF